jgi:hypothetical protein
VSGLELEKWVVAVIVMVVSEIRYMDTGRKGCKRGKEGLERVKGATNRQFGFLNKTKLSCKPKD